MKSSAVFPGTVQCPGDGAPFLLGPDAQTVGGYRRIAQVIDAALEEAHSRGIRGKDVTPFLLDRVFHATGGTSLEANIALVLNNARLAGEIARELGTNRG